MNKPSNISNGKSFSLRKKPKPSGGGGKWSRKYKNSINCSKPRGFSQRQYCKYGRHGRKTRRK